MSICNHGLGKDCKLCYPVYDDEIEERIKSYLDNADSLFEDLEKPFYNHGVGSITKNTPIEKARSSKKLKETDKSQRHTIKNKFKPIGLSYHNGYYTFRNLEGVRFY